MKNWIDQTPMSAYIGMTSAVSMDHGSGYSGKKSVDGIDQTGHANSSCSIIANVVAVGPGASCMPAAHRTSA